MQLVSRIMCTATLLGVALFPMACRSGVESVTQETYKACEKEEYTCVKDELSVCNSDRTGWKKVQDCAPGTCDSTKDRCPEPECTQDSDCISNKCLDTKECEPPLCNEDEYSCDEDVLRVCNDDRDSWTKVKECAPGTCDAGEESCPSPACTKDSDCVSNNCLDTKECEAPLCEEDEYNCKDDLLRVCNDDNDGWEDIQLCVPGTCDEEKDSCEERECEEAADCDSNICLPSGECEAPNISFEGFVQRYEYISATFQSKVSIQATNVLPDRPNSEPSTTQGEFSLADIPRESWVDLELTWDQGTPLPVSQTRVAVASGSDMIMDFNPPVVNFDWLAKTAFQCGIFETEEEAQAEANGYFLTRSTVLVEVRDKSGDPVSGVTREDISVRLGALNDAGESSTWSNTHLSEEDASSSPAFVCFLDVNDGGSLLEGTTLDASSDVGRFVVFRVRNSAGYGTGIAQINVDDYPAVSVFLRSSGQIGVVQVGDNLGFEAQPELPRDFEADVYPLFEKLGCRGCHSPVGEGGFEADHSGFVKAILRGENELAADYSGTPDEVYAVLMAANESDCSSEENLGRVCTDDPELSLLLRKPFVDESPVPDHPNTSFFSEFDPNYRALLEWISQGAKR